MRIYINVCFFIIQDLKPTKDGSRGYNNFQLLINIKVTIGLNNFQ
jgi:hypothetical protein